MKLRRNLNNFENRKFGSNVDRVQRKIDKGPEGKKQVNLYYYKGVYNEGRPGF